MKQRKYDRAYLKMAQEWAKLSHCKRKKVGALIVKDKMIISDGYNGCPSGFENTCEDATLYVTLSPCQDCSKLIHQSGIKRVVYLNEYKDTTGLEFLKKANVELLHFKDVK